MSEILLSEQEREKVEASFEERLDKFRRQLEQDVAAFDSEIFEKKHDNNRIRRQKATGATAEKSPLRRGIGVLPSRYTCDTFRWTLLLRHIRGLRQASRV